MDALDISETAPIESTTVSEDQARLLLGRYRLVRRLGSGGFGTVWEAFDERLQRQVAVKEVASGGGGTKRKQRTEREALAAARLSHPKIVSLYESSTDGDTTYLVSELVRGRTLSDLIDDGELSDREIAYVGIDICDALAHAHAAGVIHRDVKPENVIVTGRDDGEIEAKLMDFGVAHLASSERLTVTGDVIGTLAYMAPEQAQGRKVAQPADAYSLAITLYEAFAGVNPVAARGPTTVLAGRVGRIKGLRRYRRDLPSDLSDAIDAALDPRPQRRAQVPDLRGTLASVIEELDDEPNSSSEWGGLWALAPDSLTALPGWCGRTLSALATAVALAAAYALLPAVSSASVVAVAFAAAAIAYVLPRTAWLATSAFIVASVATASRGGAGAATVAAITLALPVLLIPRNGRLWPLAAAAPALGTVGLAPLSIALIAVVRVARVRVALALSGLWWAVMAQLFVGKDLLNGLKLDVTHLSSWKASIPAALEDVIWPAVAGPFLPVAFAWAALAVLLPLIVRGRYLAVDFLASLLWGAALVASMRAIADAQPAGWQEAPVNGALISALITTAFVVAMHCIKAVKKA